MGVKDRLVDLVGGFRAVGGGSPRGPHPLTNGTSFGSASSGVLLGEARGGSPRAVGGGPHAPPNPKGLPSARNQMSPAAPLSRRPPPISLADGRDKSSGAGGGTGAGVLA